MESAKNLYDSYVKDGEVISWKNATDLITLGLSVAGMGMAEKSLAKDGKALKAVSQGNVNVKPAAVSNSTTANNSVAGKTGLFKMNLQMFASSKKTNPNALKYNRNNGTWTSNKGVIYGKGSKDGNRVKHVLKHTMPDNSKPLHTVFNVDKSKVIGLIDEAWVKRGQGIL